MEEPTAECAALVQQLQDVAGRLQQNGSDEGAWKEVARAAQALADALRESVKKGPENHTALGNTRLPSNLNTLVKYVLKLPPANDAVANATFELLRVGANLCINHDGNREQLLDAGFLQSVVSLLERYVESIPPAHSTLTPLPLSIPHLKVVKTAIGVLLNATLGYEPVRFRLTSLEASVTILNLSAAIYPPGSWAVQKAPLSPNDPATDEALIESWTLRSGLSNWAWRTISELKADEGPEEGEQVKSPNPQQLFGPDSLPTLVRQLRGFIPPYPAPAGPYADAALRRPLASADFEVLEEACTFVESLCLDVEDVRLSLARGLSFPDGEHGGVRCLEEIAAFVERGDYPPLWADEPTDVRQKRQKSFDFCKAALIKAVVEVAGEDKNLDVLWDDSEANKPGGPFVSAMISWLKQSPPRDDLIICASLSLGNLVRREAHSLALVNPPIELTSDLVRLLSPTTDIKVKHGVLGLLRHIAQSPVNRPTLGEAGVIPALVTSGIWDEKADMAELVQMSAIGTAKHLCNSEAKNSLALVSPAGEGAAHDVTPLQQLLALTRRSDSVAVKSEGTRVLVNVIKSLWSNDSTLGDQRKQAMGAVVTPPCAQALAQMVGRSKKYPILINEGVVALTLMSTHAQGGALVFDALTAPLPAEASSRGQSVPTSAASTSSEMSPVVGPPRALDTLLAVLKNKETRFQPEARANVCTLLGQLGRAGAPDDVDAQDVARIREQVRPALEDVAALEKDGKGMVILVGAAERALANWP